MLFRCRRSVSNYSMKDCVGAVSKPLHPSMGRLLLIKPCRYLGTYTGFARSFCTCLVSDDQSCPLCGSASPRGLSGKGIWPGSLAIHTYEELRCRSPWLPVPREIQLVCLGRGPPFGGCALCGTESSTGRYDESTMGLSLVKCAISHGDYNARPACHRSNPDGTCR